MSSYDYFTLGQWVEDSRKIELLERAKEQLYKPEKIIEHLKDNPSAARQVVEALAGECGYQKKEKRGIACPTCKGHGCVNMEQDTCPECDGYGEI